MEISSAKAFDIAKCFYWEDALEALMDNKGWCNIVDNIVRKKQRAVDPEEVIEVVQAWYSASYSNYKFDIRCKTCIGRVVEARDMAIHLMRYRLNLSAADIMFYLNRKSVMSVYHSLKKEINQEAFNELLNALK